MAVVRWVFYDPETDETETFLLNPDAGGSPSYIKHVATTATSAPDGVLIAYEGQDEPKTTEFSGTILTQEQYDMHLNWFSRRHPVEMTDDLGRTFAIYIISFEPKRVRAASHPWKHTYTVRYLVVSQVS